MITALISTAEEFWNIFLFGTGSWLYIVILLAIIFLVSLKFKWFGLFGVLVSIFSIFSIITYSNSTVWSLDAVYKCAVFTVAIILNLLLIAEVIEK